ncbi:transporter substrate-binding domain-containing protein [Aminipila butyrica]|uniref:Transporter substrate-binding domain-containing protein n=1 Tax=Aminipila butyrica TaxID=433296 RepID=A0A858C054_9FIRM|nr:transporter substrate-binding domain-containing protein [Aminipila butyrica]QIB70590.1 transporter substrate-binding domain-containing protein [Aminipila butyrica]
MMVKNNQRIRCTTIRILLALLALLTALAFLMPADLSFGQTKAGIDKKVVRVGYYLYEGYQEVDGEGVYSGYGYDYLKEISQFANWEYEFIQASFPDCIQMLEKGEVDIVGGLDKEALQSDKIAYSHLSNRISDTLLYVKASDEDLNFDDFEKMDGIAVGVPAKDYHETYLDDYASQHHITFEKKYYATLQDMENALEKGEVRAILTSGETNKKYSKVIGSMDQHQLYYGVNKKNQGLLNELNQSMQNIKNSNPSYDLQIQNKYFIKENIASPSFTAEELEYIKKKGTVKVSYDQGWQPIEYYDEKTGTIKGVTKDLFDLLSRYTGLKFEFVRATDLSEALDDVKTGRTDMISLVSHDYNVSEKRGIYTTSICINASLVGVVAKERNFDGIEQVAMPKDYYVDILKHYKVKEYDTVEDCFEAVNSGEADATIANAYAANYYLANPKFVNLISQAMIGYSEDLSLGVSNQEDIELLNILNKGLHCISDMELSNIILKNYVVYEQPKFRKLYYSNPAFFLGSIIVLVAAAIGVLTYLIMLKNKMNATNLKMIEFLNIEKSRMENSLRSEADRDMLTGLFNRRKIEAEVREFLLKISVDEQIRLQNNDEPGQGLHSLMIIDLDGFKLINDRYGHPEGDTLLKRIATELEQVVGEENLVGRLGGDEFVFLFKNIDGKTEAKMWADIIRRTLSSISQENEKWQNISASVGVTLFGAESYSFKELYEKADGALYQAKETGKNKAVICMEI